MSVAHSYLSAHSHGFGLIEALRNTMARRKVYRQTLRELRGLSNRDLSDLGISRFQLPSVAAEAAFGK